MADTVLRAGSLDEAAALEAKRQAELAMENKNSEMDYSTALAQLVEAVAQLRTIQQSVKSSASTKPQPDHLKNPQRASLVGFLYLNFKGEDGVGRNTKNGHTSNVRLAPRINYYI